MRDFRPQETTLTQVLFRTGMIIFLCSLIAFFSIYTLTKKEFEQRINEELLSITEIIKQSIESTHESTKTLEHLVDLRLFTISEVIAEELKGKRIDEVTREELIEISKKWGLSNISLLVLEEDGDIPVVQSTDPDEIGLNAKDWGYWYTAILELFEGKSISVNRGFSQPHYWIGPLSLSEVNDHHYKYAYYYDGQTDFMINPYIKAEDIYQFMDKSGPTQLINKIKESYNHTREIAVINIPAYLKEKPARIIEPITDKPVLYGTHEYITEQDELIFRNSLEAPVFERFSFKRDEEALEKIFVSLPEDRLLTIVLDLQSQRKVQSYLIWVFSGFYLLATMAIFILGRLVARRPVKKLQAERERLKVAEEFKRTAELLPSAIYKCKKDSNGVFVFTYLEGTVTSMLGLGTQNVLDRHIEDILPKRLSHNFITALDLAYVEGSSDFTFTLGNRTYHSVLKAVVDPDDSTAVLEVAGYSIDITEQVKANERIHHLAYYDSLTALPNRACFLETLDLAINENSEKCLSLLFIDLDGFKQINDTLGHNLGDILLQQVSRRLRSGLDKSAFLARMAGDEFTLILENYQRQETEESCKLIIHALKEPFLIENHEIYITTSIGVSLFPDDGEDSQTLLKNADMAMYASKQQGKNGYHFYQAEMNEKNVCKMKIRHDLHQALIQGKELSLVYQPQHCLETNQIIGLEALLRWQHPTKGFISPADFIPVAEESGLIEPLGDWVLYEGCRQFQQWLHAGMSPLRLSINLSARQFKQRDLAERIEKTLAETGMDPAYLTLEITESASMEDTLHTIQTLNQLRKIGVKISIDDFGTGYSSLKYLKDLPIQHLKIDHSFIWEMRSTDRVALAIVKSIIDLAQNLQLRVVAEGVETKEEHDLLLEMGCHEIQGYYFSRPMMPEQIFDFVQEKNSLLVHD
ncbi:bifunctional diguanylate cyclase/phosphodiesterase [Ammoniphilus sp. CFH 90114]|uniref:putative bifunctional diguanylate cyclase/phosphodiesterase n=1 Tax=Ammoniphilus sp. CFH 90114 TaxID=2493665 RepID=UPI00100FB841|nr:EAL domain-containing protein [Ammoniphilus sp. CFH 90114]RXT04356.1 EAL domain-containing protein [Ammoniphilus sp. CFH 90114]